MPKLVYFCQVCGCRIGSCLDDAVKHENECYKNYLNTKD